ncbi:hypothetical protein ACHAP5_003962 [Fusarium lateritium]
MELISSNCTPDCDHDLSLRQFTVEISLGDTHWRKTQVARVLSSFEAAKRVMSRQAIHQVYTFLVAGRWTSASSKTKDHVVYRALRRRDRYAIPARFHYPRFFVVQAIYALTGEPIPECFKSLCREMSQHWGIPIIPDKPFYPRLKESEKELALMRGVYSEPPKSKTLENLDAQSASIPVVGSYDDGQQSCSIPEASRTTGIIKREPTNDANFLHTGETHNVSTIDNFERRLFELERKFERRITRVQRDLENRVGNLVEHDLSKYQAQRRTAAPGTEEDPERRLRKAQDKIKEIHQHALLAQKHADTAVKMVEALYESLNTATKRSVSADPYDDEHSSKRVREV